MNATQTENFGLCLAMGQVVTVDDTMTLHENAWKAHPVFAGVRMKTLVAGAQTGGALSCHVVQVEASCALLLHTHQGQWELHEVVQGGGELTLGAQKIPYQPGCQAVIPQGTDHQVLAGSQGITLLAKFFPAAC